MTFSIPAMSAHTCVVRGMFGNDELIETLVDRRLRNLKNAFSTLNHLLLSTLTFSVNRPSPAKAQIFSRNFKDPPNELFLDLIS